MNTTTTTTTTTFNICIIGLLRQHSYSRLCQVPKRCTIVNNWNTSLQAGMLDAFPASQPTESQQWHMHILPCLQTNLDVEFQLLCFLLVLCQIGFQPRDLIFFVVNGFVQRLQLLANPPVSFFLRTELIAATLLGIQLFAPLLTQSQPDTGMKSIGSHCNITIAIIYLNSNLTKPHTKRQWLHGPICHHQQSTRYQQYGNREAQCTEHVTVGITKLIILLYCHSFNTMPKHTYSCFLYCNNQYKLKPT